MKPLSIKLNAPTVEMITSLKEQFNKEHGVRLSNPKVVEMAVKQMLSEKSK